MPTANGERSNPLPDHAVLRRRAAATHHAAAALGTTPQAENRIPLFPGML